MRSLAAGLDYIDLKFLGYPEIIATAVLHGAGGVALVDPGPATTLGALESALSAKGLALGEVTAILLTHIHLDHAGGAGTLTQRLPNAQVYVHPVGAPHLIDPTKLLNSAGRLYGDELARLFGETIPVPESRLHVLNDSDTLTIGGRTVAAIDTPGHARHHHAYWDAAHGDLFTGDVAGVALPRSRFVRAPTPPPELDVPAWQASLRRIRALRPRRLLLTHFGPHEWVEDLLGQLEERLLEGVERVRGFLGSGLGGEAITAEMRQLALRQIKARDGAAAAAHFEVIMPIRQSVLGLIRYIEKTG